MHMSNEHLGDFARLDAVMTMRLAGKLANGTLSAINHCPKRYDSLLHRK